MAPEPAEQRTAPEVTEGAYIIRPALMPFAIVPGIYVLVLRGNTVTDFVHIPFSEVDMEGRLWEVMGALEEHFNTPHSTAEALIDEAPDVLEKFGRGREALIEIEAAAAKVRSVFGITEAEIVGDVQAAVTAEAGTADQG